MRSAAFSLVFLLLLITRAADNAMINRATINSRFLDRPGGVFDRSAGSLSPFQTARSVYKGYIAYCTPYFIPIAIIDYAKYVNSMDFKF